MPRADQSGGLHLPLSLSLGMQAMSPSLGEQQHNLQNVSSRNAGHTTGYLTASGGSLSATPSRLPTTTAFIESNQALQVLREADHHTLVYSRNPVYGALLQEKEELKIQVAALSTVNTALKQVNQPATFFTKREESSPPAAGTMFHDTSSKTLLPRAEILMPLLAADHPQILYWKVETYRSEKKKRKRLASLNGAPGKKGKQHAAKGKNIMMWYIQDDSGKKINGHRATDIRGLARAIFEQLLRAGEAPVVWSEIACDAQEFYYSEMCRRYPEL
ncbi:hypothetical protein EWM64_g4451 [Hericium alpestre]|uniref:Uncharacterized protein n=1 Tax=Hericium alpestre TaxID=135208 RepID=A0A4Z0A1G9_9AGAM|nr:hypothetical protein EWM64_g4451 [Hericium alpestre]